MLVSVQNREQQPWSPADDMDCDDTTRSDNVDAHSNRMATSLSNHSISSSTSSASFEPELSQSLGSVASFDLRTPLKPSQAANHFHEPSGPFVLQKHALTRLPAPQAKSLLAEALAARKPSNVEPNSEALQLSPERLTQSPSSARIAASAAALSPSPLSRANKPKLSLSTISSSAFSRPNLPQTPGGTLFFGARDGAADGAPVSPFMPPTPMVATMMESELARGPPRTLSSSDGLLMPAQLQRPSAPSAIATPRPGKPVRTPLKRHGSIGMSPLSRDFASVSVHSKSRSNEDAITSSPTAPRTQDLYPTSPSSSKLVIAPYSPLSSSGKSLSDESSTLGSRRTSSSSSSVSSSSSKKYKPKESLIGGSTDLTRSFSASRLKSNARIKTAPKPFNLTQAFTETNGARSDVQQQEMQPMSAPAMKISFVDAQDEGEPLTHSPVATSPVLDQLTPVAELDTPSKTPATPDTSLLSPCAALRAPAMERSFSAPLPPPTVSARHLTDYELHPRFAASYALGDELGSGGFGFVVAANRVSDSLPVAVKFIFKDKVPAHGWVRDPKLGVIPMEAFVLKVVDHPGVVKFIDLFDDRNFFYLVMELHGSVWQPPAPEAAPIATSKGLLRPAPMQRRTSRDLFECIEQHSRLSEEQARWVFAQVVETVWHLDRIGISHRDIKDENCVVDADFNVKLIDFGSAVITDIRKPQPYFNRFFGTMTFASPEILQGKPYRAPHAEIWSLGVLLSILISGQCPFPDPTAAIKGKLSKLKGAWSKEAVNLLLLCLEVDPDKRATIAEIRDHPWVHQAWRDRAAKLNQQPKSS